MSKSTLKVATIVGSSTATAWSQTYHAGGVTAVVSVRQKEGQEVSSLSLVGKDLLNTFESEYFTLPTKNLTSIKDAVALTYNKSKDTHDLSLIVAAIIQNAVYVVLAGAGKILLVRRGNLATLLEQTGEDVLSASGFLESGDVMALITLPFEEHVPTNVLLNTLTQNSIPDATEILSPAIHKEEDGAAAALLLSYEDADTEHIEKSTETQKDVILRNPTQGGMTPESEEDSGQARMTNEESASERLVIHAPTSSFKAKKHFTLTHRQKIFLTIAVILAVVFVGAIYFSLQKKQVSQNTALFTQIYTPAEKKYEEGQGLQDLNATLAQSDFRQAQQMLQSAQNKFPANSSEQKQIQALLDKVNAALTQSTPQSTTTATKVDTSTSPLLAFAAKHTDATYFAQDDNNFYFADNTGVTKTAKSSGTAKQIIQNGGDWKSIGGFSSYFGNMYVLDKSDGIDKYPVAANGFGNKIAYFSGSTPDLSKAVSLAIDSDVWILTSDGNVLKYTKGTADPFTLSGLTKSLSSPTQLVTNVDMNNLYILDNGNSRLVVIKKDGSFVADYVNPVIKFATEIDVNETGKKVYLLSGGNIYEVDLK